MTEDDYYRVGAEQYDATTLGVPGDIEFYREIALECGGPVVELGVGTGRIAIPVALAGVEVIGVDRAPEMLVVAARRAEAAGVAARLRLVEGDMRTFTVEAPVPLVTIPFRTFLHNLEVSDQAATLAACHRALRPGGRLALNVFNPDWGLVERWSGGGPRSVTPDARGGQVGARDDLGAGRPVVTSRLRWRTAGVTRRAALRVRYITQGEMETLVRSAGFRIEALFGDCRRGTFRPESTEQVWILRRGA